MCPSDKVIDIVETYEPPMLPDDVGLKIRSVVDEAEKELIVYQEKER